MTAAIDQATADAAQDDLGAFSRLIGRPLQPFQLEALTLETRHTALLAPRQTGKSFALANLVCWWLFSRPGQQILVLSAREDTAKNLLRVVRQVAAHPLLKTSIVEDLKTRLELSSGSAVEAVPSSEAAIRGRSIDLLIIDEAAFVEDELINDAALPTTAARPAARVVVASTPWGRGGVFFEWHEAGQDGSDPDTRSFTWTLRQAPWIVPSVIEALRRRMPPLKFAAEFDGQWVGDGDAFLPAADIDAAIAAYPMTRDGGGRPGFLGADWGGGQKDLSAVAITGLLDDGGVNGRPVVVVAWAETTRRDYPEQQDEIADLAARWDLTVLSECKGVGIPPTRWLIRNLTRSVVKSVKTTQELKETAYTRLAHMLASRSIVLPDDPVLRKQLLGIVARPTPLGGLRIEARTQATHDDLADALAFAVWGMPEELADPPGRDFPDGTRWVTTPGGIRVPVPVATLRADASYGGFYGGYWSCPVCPATVPAYRDTCTRPGCGGRNPDPKTPAGPQAAAAGSPAGGRVGSGSVPAHNSYNRDLRRCVADERHLFDGRYLEHCPHCHPGQGSAGPRGPQPGAALPAAFSRALAIGRKPW